MTDPLKTVTIAEIALLQGEKVIATTASRDTCSFENLVLLETYTVRISYTYDILDGKGKQSAVATFAFGTQSAGLKIKDGIIVGIGSCKDSELYINMPAGDAAFAHQQQITSIVCGNNATTLGESVFMGCDKLRSVVLSEKLASIGAYAFAKCNRLESIVIPESVTEILSGAFNLEITIYVEAKSLPSGWDSDWAGRSATVHWGYTGS